MKQEFIINNPSLSLKRCQNGLNGVEMKGFFGFFKYRLVVVHNPFNFKNFSPKKNTVKNLAIKNFTSWGWMWVIVQSMSSGLGGINCKNLQ